MTVFNRARLAWLSALVSLVLAACAAPAPTSWSGLEISPTIAYVASNTQVHAIQLTDGKQLWAYPATPTSATGQFYTEPGVSPDMIVVGSDGPANSHSGALFGLDPATGTERWCLQFDTKTSARANCTLAGTDESIRIPVLYDLFGFKLNPASDNRVVAGIVLTDGVAYVGLTNAYVYAVDAQTGAVKWSFKAGGAIWGKPDVEPDAVYVPSLDHQLYALNRADGRLRWQADLGAAAAATPAVADGRVFAGTFGNKVIALDAATGAPVWQVSVKNWVWSRPLPANGVLYVADLSGKLSALNPADGSERWSVTPGGPLRADLILLDGTLYAGDKNGQLMALNADDGAPRWQQTLTNKGQVLSNLRVVDGRVLVAPYQGSNLLEAYTTGGALQWAFAPAR